MFFNVKFTFQTIGQVSVKLQDGDLIDSLRDAGHTDTL